MNLLVERRAAAVVIFVALVVVVVAANAIRRPFATIQHALNHLIIIYYDLFRMIPRIVKFIPIEIIFFGGAGFGICENCRPTSEAQQTTPTCLDTELKRLR